MSFFSKEVKVSPRILPPIIILQSFIYLFSVSFSRWGNILVDTFRDPLIATKILNGSVLYRDILYEYGILPPYLLAAFVGLLGNHLAVFVFYGIILTLAFSVALYRISRLFLDRVVSTVLVVNFLFVFAFGQYCYHGIFNFILPYSFASTTFIVFTIYALYFFLKFLLTQRKNYLFAWAIFMFFAFSCRILLPLLVWGAFLISGLVYAIKNRKEWKIVFILFAPIIFALVGYSVFMIFTGSFSGFKEAIIDHILATKNSSFVAEIMGLTDFKNSCANIAQSFIFYIVFIALALFTCWITPFFSCGRKAFYFLLPLVLIGFVVIEQVMGVIAVRSFQFLPMQIFLIIGAVVSLIGIFRLNHPKWMVLFALCLVSLALLIRVIFHITAHHYGFYLVPISLAAYYIFFFKGFDVILKRYFPDVPRRFFSFVLIFICAMSALSWWRVSHSLYLSRNLVMRDGDNVVTVQEDMLNFRTLSAIVYLLKNTPRDATVVVVPEGAGINYLSKRMNPMRHVSFTPALFSIVDEKDVIGDFIKSSADYVVIVQRITSEHGASRFGLDYGTDLFKWIMKNYSSEKVIGPFPFTSNEFGVAILKNNNMQ
ncbi:MAG: glycosyltransferase family 39 protein [Candidatus Omnitrophica bacterium]|nr:glycosyltransferase family 39 protein [Candidatus Omnitrophota bacterium]